MNKQEILISRSFRNGTVDLLYAEHCPGGFAIARPAVLQLAQEGELADAPVLRLDKDAVQSLMDQLWNIGVRPADLNRQPALANTWLQDQLGKFIDQATAKGAAS